MLTAIVCKDQNYAIGYKNKLLFNIPEDMKWFKECTINNTVIMGRKTFESLGNKPLPNRKNIVITRDKDKYKDMESENLLFMNMYNVKAYCKNNPEENIFVIGGGEIYKEMFDYFDKLYVTTVYGIAEMSNTYFPTIDTLKWVHYKRSFIMRDNKIIASIDLYSNRKFPR